MRLVTIQKRIPWLVLVAGAILFGSGMDSRALAQESITVDRWLVSNAFPADTSDSLQNDYLAAPGEVAVLPDRGRTVSGADWTLVRKDGVHVLDLEGHRGDAGGPVAVYAHAYLKSIEDRSVSLTWSGLECTAVAAWLNGRSLAGLGRSAPVSEGTGASSERTARVRIGHGYNTLLLKAVSGDCEFGVSASIAPISTQGLDGLKVQASRPYGDTRTGPSPWLMADPDAGPEPLLGWKDKELFGVAGVRVTAFAVTAIEGARFKAKTGGEEVKRKIEWLTPAYPETVLMPLSFKSLHRASTRGEGVAVELDWKDGEWKGVLNLDPGALLSAFHSSIRLLGWTVAAGEGMGTASPDGAAIYDGEEEPHPLANLIPLPVSAGVTLVGEWEVPGWLSGFSLGLDVEGAPGEYRVNSMPTDGSGIVLCTGCRKGDRLQVVVITGGAWERFPGISIVDVAEPDVTGAVQAVEWLQRIDEKGSRKYQERASVEQ